MKRAMVSCPMNGRSEASIAMTMMHASDWLQEHGYWVVQSFVNKRVPLSVKHESVWYLAKSIEVLCEVDAVFFCKGWENARGCILEHEICKKYGIPCLYEQEDETIFEQLTLDID